MWLGAFFSNNLSVKAGNRKDETLVVGLKQHFYLHFGGGFISLQGETKAGANILIVCFEENRECPHRRIIWRN